MIIGALAVILLSNCQHLGNYVREAKNSRNTYTIYTTITIVLYKQHILTRILMHAHKRSVLRMAEAKSLIQCHVYNQHSILC